jgi:hypothetical protein
MQRPTSLGMIASVLTAMAIAATSQAAPAPGGHELILSQLIHDTAAGHIPYQAMTPDLGDAVRLQAATAVSDLSALGPLQSVTFKSIDATGTEFYRTTFERGAMDWAFSINPAGLIANARYRRAAADPS